MIRLGKRPHINVLELKVVSLALRSFKDQCQNQTVLVAKDNNGSLHKQTRRNSLSRDVCSPVEDHDMVSSLSHNIKIQKHSRVSECDGGPPVQVKPSAVNRMVFASAGVQTDLPKVVHSSCRSICHSSEPQTSTVGVSSPRPKCLGHRCSELKLDGSHCLCLPSDGSPSQGDPKNQAMADHCNSPRLARDALVLGPSAALLYQDLNRRPSTIDGYRTAFVDTLGPAAHHIAQSLDLHRLLSSFHRDHPKSSRNLPKWNLSVVLNELTKVPFEPMKDTDLKHLTLKTAFLLALASGKRCSEIQAWVANKISNLGQWEKVALYPSSDFIAKNQLARKGSQSMSPVTIPALTTIVDRQFKEGRTCVRCGP